MSMEGSSLEATTEAVNHTRVYSGRSGIDWRCQKPSACRSTRLGRDGSRQKETVCVSGEAVCTTFTTRRNLDSLNSAFISKMSNRNL